MASAHAKAHLERAARDDPELGRLLAAVEERDPLSAVREIVERVLRIDDGDA